MAIAKLVELACWKPDYSAFASVNKIIIIITACVCAVLCSRTGMRGNESERDQVWTNWAN